MNGFSVIKTDINGSALHHSHFQSILHLLLLLLLTTISIHSPASLSPELIKMFYVQPFESFHGAELIHGYYEILLRDYAAESEQGFRISRFVRKWTENECLWMRNKPLLWKSSFAVSTNFVHNLCFLALDNNLSRCRFCSARRWEKVQKPAFERTESSII